jgi:hypothetical protein
MKIKNKITVFPILFRNDTIHQLYESIEYFNLRVINKSLNKISKNNIYSHRLIPEYFKLNLRDNSFKTKVISEYNWGYSVLLKTQDSIDAFMHRQFNSKKRTIYKRYTKRLETCFDIKYRMFYGSISESDYAHIMDALYQMIINRFEQRNELHKNLNEWDSILKNSYSEIINKKASLFVIYNETEPIEISLNYHFDKILFSFISSYNVDYSKFGLGHVEIYKQIEWCANNRYIIFEMGVGGMDYKRRWSNNIYQYQHHLIYKKTTFKLKLLMLKIQLKEYLKSKGINEIYPNTISFFTSNKNTKTNFTSSDILPIKVLELSNYEQIKHGLDIYNYLEKHINDFLYTTTNHYKKIKVYKNNTEKTFLIQGRNEYQKISFK